jgi:hypothetical protein
VKNDIDEQLAGLEQMKQGLASFPPAQQEQMRAKWKEVEVMLKSPAFIESQWQMLEAERARESGATAALIQEVERLTPADPQKLFARRLREFLEATGEVNFAARTMSLTGGPDGIEFLDKPDRQRHWMCQEASVARRPRRHAPPPRRG